MTSVSDTARVSTTSGCSAARIPHAKSQTRIAAVALWPPLPLVFAILASLISIWFGHFLADQERHHAKRLIKAESKKLVAMIEGDFEPNVDILTRMAGRWAVRGGVPRVEWESSAQDILRDRPGLRAVARIDADRIVRWIMPRERMLEDTRAELYLDPRQRLALDRARNFKQAMVAAPADRVDGGKSLLILCPTFLSGRFDGFLIIEIGIESWFNHALASYRESPEFSIEITSGSEALYNLGDSSLAVDSDYAAQEIVQIGELSWSLKVTPSADYVAGAVSNLPAIATVIGLAFAGLILALMRTVQTSMQRARLSEELGQRLAMNVTQTQALIQTAPDGIVIIDTSGTIQTFNNASERLFGFTAEEAIGCNVKMLMPEPYHGEHDGYLQNYSSTGEAKIIGIGREVLGQRKDGTTFPLDLAIGEASHLGDRMYVGILRDISDRKRHEAELAARTNDLERSNAELEQFAYIASHDLQEPLRMVSSYVQLLARRYQGSLDDEADKFIAYAVEGSVRMKALINDLLEYSRIGRSGNKETVVNLTAVFDRVVTLFQEKLQQANAEIVCGALPSVMGSELELNRLFQNLIGNALKFRTDQPLRLNVSAERSDEQWCISVADNGIGIDPQYRDRVFEVFRRLNDRSKYEGTGIGLAICKRIVEYLGGRIWVDRAPEGGSIFRFTLPALQAEEAAA